ncbi:MAG TPA: DUF1080 domain-containing protein [Pirellulales bacterium]|nr:DUF1080 domain-containing protein [Pirellulales bacterium]
MFKSMTASVMIAILPCLVVAAEPGKETGKPDHEKEPGHEKEAVLFDGKTFDGWQGDTQNTFRIEQGAIVGGSLKQRVPRNEFLTTEREYGDFELKLKFKVLGEGANAGVQIRSRRIPNHHEMIGYQADLGDGWWGSLYDESRRNKMLATADKKLVEQALKRGDWNDYTIRCQGRRIQLWINDRQTVDYTEADETIEQLGLIGLQIHGGPPSEAWYKDIRIRELPQHDKR